MATYPSNQQTLDHVMTSLAETGRAVYGDPSAEWDHPSSGWIDMESIREACKDEGVKVRFRFRDGDGAWVVTLRKVGKGH